MLSPSLNLSEIQTVEIWVLIAFISQVPLFLYFWVLVKRHSQFSFPYVHSLKYIGGALALALTFFLTSDYVITFQESIFEFLPGLIIELIICVAVYLLVTFLIDKKTRILVNGFITEVQGKINEIRKR